MGKTAYRTAEIGKKEDKTENLVAGGRIELPTYGL